MNMGRYVRWLKETNRPLYEVAGTYWRPYHNALVPASLMPEPMELTGRQAQELLDRSGALFLRYFTKTLKYPTDFWYSVCSEYSFKNLPQKVRTHIRRALKSCRIERIDPVWLSDNGYPCYTAAYSRYRNALPESRERFDDMCRGSLGGPFEFWGAFVGEQLAGFAKCAVEQDYAACLVLKLDPNFIQMSTGSALKDAILNSYVSEQGKPVYAGFRSVVHDTNTHDFLTKLGYSRVYCDLKVVYRPAIRTIVNLLHRFPTMVGLIPESNLKNNIRALLIQEQIQRSTELDGKRPYRPSISERITRSVWGNRYGVGEK